MGTERNFDHRDGGRLNNVTPLPFIHYIGDDYRRLPHDLVLLEDLPGYRIARGEADPRGWEVQDRMGEKVGRIRYLVVSPSMQQVYFAVIDGGVPLRDKQLVVALSRIVLQPDVHRVLLPYLKEELQDAPPFERHSRDFARFAAWWNAAEAGGNG